MDDSEVSAVMRNGDLSIGARLLWWELCQWVTGDLNVCFPTQYALADNLGVSRQSVIRWLQELREIGFVEIESTVGGNRYILRNGESLAA